MKIVLETLGCKLNQAESEALSRQLVEAGHQLVASVDEAEIYILNTCTVTHTADSKARHLLRLAHRNNPNAHVVVTGCYAQRAAQELSKIEGVSLVVNNDQKSDLAFLLEDLGCVNGLCAIPDPDAADGITSRTRTFIKIQDGCTKFCSYCIVPLVRGVEKSQPADTIVSEIQDRVADGVKEVVLTGTEVGAYDDNGVGLKTLLERILAETDDIRIRLSSLQPQEITEELIELWRDPRMCPHFHISLQSGSDSVLKRMKRGYSTDDYLKAVSLIRSVLPEAAITTDIIAGFPGETSTEFEQSYDFCKQIGFARIHVFSYSAREGTEAAASLQVEDKVKTERNQKLLALAEECSLDFRRWFLGRTMDVLWEHESGGVRQGHTDNYIRVYTKNAGDFTNQILSTRLTEIQGDGVWGEILVV